MVKMATIFGMVCTTGVADFMDVFSNFACTLAYSALGGGVLVLALCLHEHDQELGGGLTHFSSTPVL